MKSWQRSARWPPSMVQSLVRDRPRPGTGKPTAGRAGIGRRGRDPQPVPRRAGDQAAGDPQRPGRRRPGQDPLEITPQGGLAAQRGDGEEGTAQLDRDVGDGEDQPARPECLRQGDRHHQAHQHRGQQQGPDCPVIGMEPVGDPRRVHPCPPDREQQQRGLGGAAQAQLPEQQVGELGDGEHVHQVEEELGVRDALAVLAAGPQQPARCCRRGHHRGPRGGTGGATSGGSSRRRPLGRLPGRPRHLSPG